MISMLHQALSASKLESARILRSKPSLVDAISFKVSVRLHRIAPTQGSLGGISAARALSKIRPRTLSSAQDVHRPSVA